MRTADGVTITHGLRVWDYDMARATVDLNYREPEPETNQNNGHVEWWFYVVPDRYAQCDDTCTVDCGACKGRGVGHKMMSESRVATRHPFTGEAA